MMKEGHGYAFQNINWDHSVMYMVHPNQCIMCEGIIHVSLCVIHVHIHKLKERFFIPQS